MRTFLIDDHTLFRQGLREILERRDVEVVGEAGDGREGTDLARRCTAIDVVLLDLRMPGMDGLETLTALRAAGIQAPVVMLTTSADESDLVACLRQGAQGYLLKDAEPDELMAALHTAMAGQTVVAPHLAPVLARFVQQGSASVEQSPFAALTPREQEILAQLAEGHSNKVIARHLSISDGTVKLHVKAILRKLDLSSRVEAAVLAVQHGFRASESAD